MKFCFNRKSYSQFIERLFDQSECAGQSEPGVYIWRGHSSRGQNTSGPLATIHLTALLAIQSRLGLVKTLFSFMTNIVFTILLLLKAYPRTRYIHGHIYSVCDCVFVERL